MKTIIMAGGKGTRIASVAPDIPKPMIPINGKPILEYQLECLKANNLTEIILVVGHLGQVIQDYFVDGGNFGCHISYYTETEPLGTAGALYKIADPQGPSGELSGDFLLIHGDIIFDMDVSRLIACHQERRALATLAAHPNSHPFDSALLVTDEEHRVRRWLAKEEKRDCYKNQVNAGIHVLSTELLARVFPQSAKIDLDREILKPAISTGRIYAYPTPEYIKDMGTPDRYQQVAADIQGGLVAARNLKRKQRAIFLDRDGTINMLKGFITKPEDFQLLEGVADSIRRINNSPYLAIVVTNQPVIARGDCTMQELDLIHQKMETDLGNAGAFIDGLFYCPHHPDKGFSGERLEYKIDCNCRKPKPGMLLEAARQYNIDLAASWMVGDETRDVRAGKAAGCKTALIGPVREGTPPDMVCRSLADFVENILV
jgi:D,D-heptose 1,7-bisphosphate phosphatase